jgi:hypothetical protein
MPVLPCEYGKKEGAKIKEKAIQKEVCAKTQRELDRIPDRQDCDPLTAGPHAAQNIPGARRMQ